MYARSIYFFLCRLFRRSPRVSQFETPLSPEVCADVFRCISRHQLEATQLSCKKFDKILSDGDHKIKDGLHGFARRIRTAVTVDSLSAVGNGRTAITALEDVSRSWDMNLCVVSLTFDLSEDPISFLLITEQLVDALLDSFPQLCGVSELKIVNPWCVPFPLESLRTLCAQLQQLEHFAIEIHWPMLREQWFLSVPKFSLQISDDLRPFVWPVDEDRLMQYLFDFSELDDSTSKYVDLTEVSVSDGFLLSLVENFVQTRNKLTVILGCSEFTAKPLRFNGYEVKIGMCGIR
ncbi:hypothetical protein AAVH_42637, partial [Aphelenchoides avenae]